MKGLFPNPVPLLKARVSTWSESPSSNSDMVEVCPPPQERFLQVLTLPTNRTLFGNGVLTDVLKIRLLKETLSNGCLQKKTGKHREEAGWTHREDWMGAGALRSLKVKWVTPWTLQGTLGTSLAPPEQPGCLPGPSGATWVPPWTLQGTLDTTLAPPGHPGYLSAPSRATLALLTSWFCVFSRTVRLWVSASLTLSFPATC